MHRLIQHTWRTPAIVAALVLTLAIGSAMSVRAGAAPAPGRQVEITLEYEGAQREVSIYVPSGYTPGTPLPVVFALHGGSGSAAVMYAPAKRIVAHAESDNFVAVFPNGLPRPETPNSRNYYWDDPVNNGYMAFLIDELNARYSIDTQRVYFVGFSGGAKLIYELAADPAMSARIAGVGTVAGTIGSKPVLPATSAWAIIDPSVGGGTPMAAFLVQGQQDPKLPAAGGFDDDGEKILVGFETKVAIWQHFVGALAESNYPAALPAGVAAREWNNAQTGHAVVAVVDENLGHAWPSWDLMGELWSFWQRMPVREAHEQ